MIKTWVAFAFLIPVLAGTSARADLLEDVQVTVPYGYRTYRNMTLIDASHLEAKHWDTFFQLTSEEQQIFLQKREVLLQGLALQVLNLKIPVGFFSLTKQRFKSALEWQNWDEAMRRTFVVDDQWTNHELRMQERSEVVMRQFISVMDKQLWERAVSVTRSHDWVLSFGAGILGAFGVHKATTGFGFVMGVEVSQSFDDFIFRINKYTDIMKPNMAFFPTALLSVAGHLQVYLNQGEREPTETLSITFLPGGPSVLKTDDKIGFGFSAGPPLIPPPISTFAFFRVAASRTRAPEVEASQFVIQNPLRRFWNRKRQQCLNLFGKD